MDFFEDCGAAPPSAPPRTKLVFLYSDEEEEGSPTTTTTSSTTAVVAAEVIEAHPDELAAMQAEAAAAVAPTSMMYDDSDATNNNNIIDDDALPFLVDVAGLPPPPPVKTSSAPRTMRVALSENPLTDGLARRPTVAKRPREEMSNDEAAALIGLTDADFMGGEADDADDHDDGAPHEQEEQEVGVSDDLAMNDDDDDWDDEDEEDEEDEELDHAIMIAIVQRLVECCRSEELDEAIRPLSERFVATMVPLLEDLEAERLEPAEFSERVDGDVRRFQRIFRQVYRPRDAPIIIDGVQMDL